MIFSRDAVLSLVNRVIQATMSLELISIQTRALNIWITLLAVQKNRPVCCHFWPSTLDAIGPAQKIEPLRATDILRAFAAADQRMLHSFLSL